MSHAKDFITEIIIALCLGFGIGLTIVAVADYFVDKLDLMEHNEIYEEINYQGHFNCNH